MEMKRLAHDKEGDKKKKTLSIKIEEKDYDFNDEEISLISQNFISFMKRKKQQEDQQKNEERPSFNPIYLQCGKKQHIIPNFSHNQKRNQNQKKSKKFQKKDKKAYISWNNNDMDFSDNEEANKFFIMTCFIFTRI